FVMRLQKVSHLLSTKHWSTHGLFLARFVEFRLNLPGTTSATLPSNCHPPAAARPWPATAAGCHLDAGVADIGWLVLRGANKQAAGSGQTQTDCVLRRAPRKNLHSAVSNICPPPTASGTAFATGVVKPKQSRP